MLRLAGVIDVLSPRPMPPPRTRNHVRRDVDGVLTQPREYRSRGAEP
jgi:hypothetical protein